MSWSSNAPSGVTFNSSTKKTVTKRWNHSSASPMSVWTARGTGTTFYVKVTVGWDDGALTQYYKDDDGARWAVGNDYEQFNMPGSKAAQTKYFTGTSGAGGSFRVRVCPGTSLSNAAEVYTATVPVATYPVTYNANGGTGAPAATEKAYGLTLILSSSVPTRSGYNFVKWNTKADGTGTDYYPEGSYSGNAAVTFYAQWTKANIPVYVNDNGTIHQVEKVYANVGGTIKECTVYANVGGTIKTLI